MKGIKHFKRIKIKNFLKIKRLKSIKSFTLIELFIVVALIGVLASVVMVSLSSARKKAQVSAVKQAMYYLINQGAIYLNDHPSFAEVTTSPRIGCYISSTFLTDTFFADNTPAQIIANIDKNGAPIACAISASGNSFSLIASVGDNMNLCVDSEGAKVTAQYIDNTTGLCVVPPIISPQTPMYINSGGHITPSSLTISVGTIINFSFTGSSQTRTIECVPGGPTFTVNSTNNLFPYQFNSVGSYTCQRNTNGGQASTITVQ